MTASDLQPFLKPTSFIDSNDSAIQAAMERITSGASSPVDHAIALFRFVRDEIRYEFLAKQTPEEYVASGTLARGVGFCVQKAVLLCALGRAASIPTALVLCDVRDHSLSPRVIEGMGSDMLYHHGLTAFYLNGAWRKADASLTRDIVARKKFRAVEFDGTADALHAETTLEGAPHAFYLKFHGLFADVPFESMVNAYRKAYGGSQMEVLSKKGAVK